MKLIIIGGVAGGASAAARARRLDEKAEIVMFERGEHISFANCGMPYHVGGVIKGRDRLLIMTPEAFRKRTAIDVRILQEVTSVDPGRRVVAVADRRTGKCYEEPYDKLILATGASPIQPSIPGADDPEVLKFWTLGDMDRILASIDQGASSALVVGGGFVGLELAENLLERGLAVDIVEMLPQVLPTLDAEMARPLAEELLRRGVGLHLGRSLAAIERGSGDGEAGGAFTARLDNGESMARDLVVLSVGVRPNSELAAAAGLELGERRAVIVDEGMRTSDPDIYAVGDVAAVRNPVTGGRGMIPLAGPANRQGRVAAENALGGQAKYAGSLGTSVLKVFGKTAASVGLTETRLRAEKLAYEKVYVHPWHHASYYPGASPLAIKLIFASGGRILGAQAVGDNGADKRIDVIATAMRAGLTVRELADLELAYAPPFGSAKDPVNYAGMVAANALDGRTELAHCDRLPGDAFFLDVREPDEFAAAHLPGATLIPLGELRGRLGELPRDRPIIAYCKVGLRGYLAERILRQNGFAVRNLSGGLTTWRMFQPLVKTAAAAAGASANPAGGGGGVRPGAARQVLDVCGLQCPGPVVRLRQALDGMPAGAELALCADAGFLPDLESWCAASGHELFGCETGSGRLQARIRKGEAARAAAAGCGSGREAAGKPDRAALVVFSNDLDKVMAAFIIATGLATLGTRVSMFFTFWGLNVLRKDNPPPAAKDLLSRMFGWMMPRGARKLALSKLHMLGMGTAMMKHVMAQKRVPALPELVSRARELGVRFIACDMAMNVMGLRREELIEGVDELAGVASFAALARESGTVLFI